MTDSEKTKFIEYLSLEGELKALDDRGTELMINGIHSTPQKIASACIFNEDSSYMRDYITESGRISKLNFNRLYDER